MLLVAVALAVLGAGPAAGTDASIGPAANRPAGAFMNLQYPLEGTRWRLSAYRDAGGMTTVLLSVVARLTLTGGRARAGVGCGPIRASYSLVEPPEPPEAQASQGPGASDAPTAPADGVGEPLLFSDIEPAERTCPVQSAVVGESLVEGLASASRFTIEPGSEPWQAVLRIHDEAGQEALTFRVDEASSLAHGQWLLPTAGEDPAVLAFDPTSEGRRSRGRVLGSTGCNSLSARYILEGSVLELRGLETSDLPCPPSLADDETRILEVLGAVSLLVDLPPGRLVLRDPRSGARLELASERPLEGPTWQLTRLPGRGPPGVTVTLRLEDGTLSGEGPCGPYSGAYRTNGLLIEISDLRVDDADCPRRGLERAWLRALRRTMFVDARGPGLLVQDASGRVLATLRRPGAL
jgi:heat shock protein HslJ